MGVGHLYILAEYINHKFEVITNECDERIIDSRLDSWHIDIQKQHIIVVI
jgi:hypothetical protein